MNIGRNLGLGVLMSKGVQRVVTPEAAGKDLFSGRPSKLTHHLPKLVGPVVILNNDEAD
jgi:hypothetical protein